MKKNVLQRGISLVSLAITIIILLILAGVGMSSILKDDNIFDGAAMANEKTKIFQEKEAVLQSATFAIGKSKIGIIEKEKLEKELKNFAGKDKTEVTTIGKNFSIEFVESKRIYEINEDGEIVNTNFENSQPVIDDIFKDIMGAEDIAIETKYTKDTTLFAVSDSGVINGFYHLDYNSLPENQQEQMKNVVIGENVGANMIAQDAFKGLSFIETLYISNSNLNIDISAFDSTSIKDIVIMANRVESKSFYNLYKLENLTLKVNIIGDSAFEMGNGRVLTVRANIIGNRAFYNNYGLQEADVKANEIGDQLFASCGGLKTASIATNSLGNNAFYQNSNLQMADITIYENKLKTNTVVDSALQTLTLNVKGIESGAINNCWNLTNIIINSNLKKEDVATDFIINPNGNLKITYNGVKYTVNEFLQILQ